MTRQAVKSSRIKSVGYDDRKRVLTIEFKRGAVWSYTYVPENLFERLLSAESKGKFFNEFIRPFYPGKVTSETSKS